MFKLKPKPGVKPQALAAFNQDSEDEEEKCNEASTTSASSLQVRGQARAEAGEWEEALQAWSQALALHPPPLEQAVLHELRAQVLMEVGGKDWDAVKEAQRSVELAPHYAPGYLTLARAQLNFGEPHLALESYERLLAVQPENNEARAELDTCRMLALQSRQRPGQRAHVGASGSSGSAAGH